MSSTCVTLEERLRPSRSKGAHCAPFSCPHARHPPPPADGPQNATLGAWDLSADAPAAPPARRPAGGPLKREVLGHPVGLYVLVATEVWERFSYYGMRALLILYLTKVIFSREMWQARAGFPLGAFADTLLPPFVWSSLQGPVLTQPGGVRPPLSFPPPAGRRRRGHHHGDVRGARRLPP